MCAPPSYALDGRRTRRQDARVELVGALETDAGVRPAALRGSRFAASI